jgi:hypothetical protein
MVMERPMHVEGDMSPSARARWVRQEADAYVIRDQIETRLAEVEDHLDSLKRHGALGVYPIRDGAWRALAQELKAKLIDLEHGTLAGDERAA